MAIQTHTAALNPLKTVQLTGLALTSATLRATIKIALLAAPHSMSSVDADALLDRVKHIDMKIQSAATSIYMSDAGQTVDNTMMTYDTGEKRQIRNCKFAAGHFAIATIFTDDVYDIRLELYS